MDEYTPPPQSAKQKQVEARLLAIADDIGGKQGLSRALLLPDGSGHGSRLRASNLGRRQICRRFAFDDLAWEPCIWPIAPGLPPQGRDLDAKLGEKPADR